MKRRDEFDLPPELEADMARARRLEQVTLGVMVTAIAAVGLAMGSSQAMKAAWVEDLLALVPPIAFLVAGHYRHRPSTDVFPYGFHRSVSIAFLAASVALTIFGGYLLIESATTLITREHPTIPTMVLFGEQVWAGWVMMAALVYSGIPPLILGRMKTGPARRLHDKALKADADMNRADWLTAGAGVAGIAGVGFGYWWADSVAAGIISLDVAKDGITNLKRCIADLMDQRPTTVDGRPSDVPERVAGALRALSWVRDAEVRIREEGHVFAGEAFVVPTTTEHAVERIAAAARVAQAVDWRVHDIVVTLVGDLDGEGAERAPERGANPGDR